jgi:predicted acyl esterase
MKAKLKVKSSCEDTCFYVRISLCKKEGDYGLRDDINQISNFKADYISGDEIEMDFSFDEHSFVISKGEKLRIDISSSAFPLYVRHTNFKGLFSEQTKTQKAINTVVLNESFVEIPLSWRCKSQSK